MQLRFVLLSLVLHVARSCYASVWTGDQEKAAANGPFWSVFLAGCGVNQKGLLSTERDLKAARKASQAGDVVPPCSIVVKTFDKEHQPIFWLPADTGEWAVIGSDPDKDPKSHAGFPDPGHLAGARFVGVIPASKWGQARKIAASQRPKPAAGGKATAAWARWHRQALLYAWRYNWVLRSSQAQIGVALGAAGAVGATVVGGGAVGMMYGGRRMRTGTGGRLPALVQMADRASTLGGRQRPLADQPLAMQRVNNGGRLFEEAWPQSRSQHAGFRISLQDSQEVKARYNIGQDDANKGWAMKKSPSLKQQPAGPTEAKTGVPESVPEHGAQGQFSPGSSRQSSTDFFSIGRMRSDQPSGGRNSPFDYLDHDSHKTDSPRSNPHTP